jgi:hypothetical protein
MRSRRLTPARGVLVGSLLIPALVAGCAADEGGVVASGCAATVQEASLAAEVSDQIRLLDQAMVRCRSFEELAAEMGRYPGIVGYELSKFVELRCSRVVEEAVRTSPACLAVAVTTVPASTLPTELVFVGDTLDGRTVEIRPDADTTFVGQVPQVVQQTVDIAVESGCPGVLAQRDLWASRANDPVTGDEASVYANHAQNVANYIGCPATPIATVPAT